MNIRSFFIDNIGINDDMLLNQLIDIAEIQHMKKSEHLIEMGEKIYYVDFLINGVLRGFLNDEQGNEMTDCFVYKCGDAIVSIHGFEEYSSIGFETIVETTVLRVPLSFVMEAMKQYRELEHIYNKRLLDALHVHWNIKKSLYQLSAKERYLWFQEEYQEIFPIIPLRYIASFLNIAPQSLSRIRRELGGGRERFMSFISRYYSAKRGQVFFNFATK